MFTLPALPYADNALEPYISQRTLQHHHGKHHKTYVDKLNALLSETHTSDTALEDIVLTASGAVFNNAAQVWNHSFYWDCLSDTHHQQPSPHMHKALEKHFGSYDDFIRQFSEKASGIFGSGWCWLVLNPEDFSLAIECTSNAETPITRGLVPLLTCDVWEHAYYLDTQNKRPEYIKNFWQVVNWEAISKQYEKHTGAS